MTEKVMDCKVIPFPNQSQAVSEERKQIRQQRMKKRKRRIRAIRLFMLIACILTIIAVSKAAASGFSLIDYIVPVNPPLSKSFDIVGLAAEATDSKENWALLLINKDNPLPDSYEPKLSSLKNGLQFDSRAITQLNSMLSAAKEQGLSPVVCSAYRSVERQRVLFDNQVKVLMGRGLSYDQAETEACKSVAYPGTSEHNSGLAADVVSLNYQILDKAQEDTPESKWLIAHCAEYGFILRYPQDKSDLTGVMYEPWHYRYVGIQAAKEIMENGICLEEYSD